MNVLQLAGVIGGIFLLDIALSGDNALVIGVATSGLQRSQRLYAFLIGGAGAIGLRIGLTSIASVLLNIPFLQTFGGALLIYVAYKLLHDRYHPDTASSPDQHTTASRNSAFRSALKTIIIADVTMSLDNILAVGALSNGDALPLIIGLLLSITILLLGSAIISVIAERFRWLLDVAALILGWTSATMITDDLHVLAVSHHINWLIEFSNKNLPLNLSWLLLVIAFITCGLVVVFNLRFRLHSSTPQETTSTAETSFKKVV